MRKSAILHIVQPLPISILTRWQALERGHIENFSQILSLRYLRVGNNGIYFMLFIVYIIFNPESSTSKVLLKHEAGKTIFCLILFFFNSTKTLIMNDFFF